MGAGEGKEWGVTEEHPPHPIPDEDCAVRGTGEGAPRGSGAQRLDLDTSAVLPFNMQAAVVQICGDGCVRCPSTLLSHRHAMYAG